MFSDESTGAAEFASSWRKERYVIDNYCQTSELKIRERGIQAIKRRDKEVQTDELEENTHFARADDRYLRDLLLKWEPYISELLSRNAKSTAFEGYSVAWQDSASTITTLHTLHNEAEQSGLEVTCLSWNSTGSVIAAALGRCDHEDWCTHRSSVCTWNLDRQKLDVNKADTSIDANSCVMCLAFHPKQPALLAAGTFNGEVLVWDLRNSEDPLLASTASIEHSEDGHREPVSQLAWVEEQDDRGSSKYSLCSVGQDGKMLVWSLNTKKGSLLFMEGFILLAGNMPRSSRVTRRDTEMGVSSISHVVEDRETFVVGAETGGLFKCSVHAHGDPAGRHVESSVPLHSPVTFAYRPHSGPVHAVHCSPFHRNLVLSCSADGSAAVFNLLQFQPLLLLEPGCGYLYSAQWSPSRPQVFALATGTGHVLVYDLRISTSVPVHKLEAANKQPVYSLQFNAAQPRLLATGDASGSIRIWQLSDDLTSASQPEVKALSDFASQGQE